MKKGKKQQKVQLWSLLRLLLRQLKFKLRGAKIKQRPPKFLGRAAVIHKVTLW